MPTFSSMPIAGTGGGTSAGVDTRSSEIHVMKVSASHVLTISGYTHSKSAVAPSEHIGSSFTAAGHRWFVLYYPRGHGHGLEDDADYISLFLSCTDTDVVKARLSLCLLDKDGKVAYTCKCRSYIPNPPMSSLHGASRFITRKDLENSGHVLDDRFRIGIDMTVFKVVRKEHAGAAVAKLVDVPPSDISQHLGDLLSSGEGADVMFEVDGESFGAHRAILAARSPVFKAELFSPMEEGTATCVWVEDMEPRVFKALLHFVYNDVLPEIDEAEAMVMAQHLLVAADRYCLERMKLICEEKLCSYIDTGSVGTMLALADQHGCLGLQKACLNFLMSGGNMMAAVVAGGLERVMSNCPSVKELLLKSCSRS
ncbi:BTB/POZ and MATH domain-containing protein 1 [Sorghum bicolor]|nr:BTB/POZ and MATH domain-containing protein 1 [Sorghum bicolor]|eukprot:XP_002449867.1 BTB/POZ and MATH domain-containing protein 1 [Sorghum bicolor]